MLVLQIKNEKIKNQTIFFQKEAIPDKAACQAVFERN